RQQSGVSKERIAKSPSYARSRENSTEFGRASSAGKLVRVAVRMALGERYELFEDPTVVNRLTPRMGAIVKADPIHDRGERIVLPENLPLLHGFGFNAVAALKDVLYVMPHCAYCRDSGVLEVGLPALYPDCAISAPEGAELCSFHVAAFCFNPDYERLPFMEHRQEL